MFNLMIQIINSQKINKNLITVKNTKQNCFLLNILWKENFIAGYKIINKKEILIYFNYKIKNCKFLSLPSKKMYYNLKQLWKINSNVNVSVLSTVNGVITLSECKKKKVGGNFFFTIY